MVKNKAVRKRRDKRQNPTRKKAMLQALVKTLGIVTEAAKLAKVNRDSHYLWMERDPAYKKAVEGIADIALDFAESALHSQISEGEVSSTIFYLKTKGKGRGYIERVENVLSGNLAITQIGGMEIK